MFWESKTIPVELSAAKRRLVTRLHSSWCFQASSLLVESASCLQSVLVVRPDRKEKGLMQSPSIYAFLILESQLGSKYLCYSISAFADSINAQD